VQVSQGETVLYQQRFQLLVNEIMEIPGDWTKKFDPNGADIRIKVLD
jgi:hypothetical protein